MPKVAMTCYLLAKHLFNFVLPAALMAALLAVFVRFFATKSGFSHNWWAQLAINFGF